MRYSSPPVFVPVIVLATGMSYRVAGTVAWRVTGHVFAITAYCMVAAALIGGGYALEVWYLATH